MGINADMIPDEDGLTFYRLYSLIPDSQVALISHTAPDDRTAMEKWRSALLRDVLKTCKKKPFEMVNTLL